MLTRLHIKNFKRLKEAKDIPLNNAVVFIGPNNSGKTTALQALSLWHIGLTKWLEKRLGKSKAQVRTGVPINRRDVFAIPTPNARLLWNDLLVRNSKKGKKGTDNIKIQIVVEGVNEERLWISGLEFDYQGEEILYCRPIQDIKQNTLLEAPELFKKIRVAYLPPMSGLVSQEPKLLPATVSYRIGEGRTAEVLRNLCYEILFPELPGNSGGEPPEKNWQFVVEKIKSFFGVSLQYPVLNERGEIEIKYLDEKNNELDLSSSGRGLQQVLLLIAYLMTNTGAVLLLDEPDAHLEILRQRQVYTLLTDFARRRNSQIIAASHSEVILNEAAAKDIVIGFIGTHPHQINDKGSQLMKSLKTIGFQDYYSAELKKWVLYLEGSTDLFVLQSFARILNHPAGKLLESPFVHYVSTNLPGRARDHFYGLKEAIPELKGIALFDRITKPLESSDLVEMMWKRVEIENYLFLPSILRKYAEGEQAIDLFSAAEKHKRLDAMENAIKLIIPPIALNNLQDEFWSETKASEQLERIFKEYFKSLNLPFSMYKNKFHELAELMTTEQIDDEVLEKLDAISQIAQSMENN